MSWRDNLQEASFRGVPFLYESVDGEIGRRTVLKEYPGKKAKPRVEDLGPASRKFPMNIFVLGDDYDIERDALRKEFETEGPGELVHPYWGVMQVTVHGTVRVTESTKFGGMARFSVTFIEAGDELELLESPATADAVTFSAADIVAAANAQLDELFSVVDAIESVVQEVIETIQAVASVVNAIRGKIAAVLLVVDAAKAAINAVVDGVSDLIRTPILLANAVNTMITTVVDGVTSIGAAFAEVAEFFDGEDALPADGNILAKRARVDALTKAIAGLALIEDAFPALGTGTAQQQAIKRANRNALLRFVKASCIAAVSTVAVELTYESYDQAQAMREDISELIDDLLTDEEIPDDLYGPLVDMRANLAKHFAAVANGLPELEEYTPNATLPVLVLAYQIYGDSTRETEILARNRQIRDPNAVSGGEPIQVLIDV